MNVLLVKPPFARLLGSTIYSTYPLGLMGIATVLKASGHDVTVYHDDVSNPEPIPRGHARLGEVTFSAERLNQALAVFDQVLDDVRPDAVGISYTTSDVDAARAMAEQCSRRGVRTVAGGIHPSLRPETELEFFDCVVCGEGDHIGMPQAFESDRQRLYSAAFPFGRAIPVADRDCVIGGERYSPFLRGMIQTQRGCPYHCAFCATPEVFGAKVRLRDPGEVREEVESLGVRSGRVIDDSFGVVREHGLMVCNELAKIDYTWVCDMAVRDVGDELLDAMVEAGCTQINVGLESASEKWRALSGKGATLDGVDDVLVRAQRRGVAVAVYFMIGWPGETSSELEDTIRLAKALKSRGAKPHVSIVTPYPGTALWDMCDVDDGLHWSDFMHQSGSMGFADVSPGVWVAALAAANEINR